MTPAERYVDDIAHGMTSADQTPDLRARTIAAIGARRQVGLWWKLVPAAVVGAAVLSAGVWTARDRQPGVPMPAAPGRAEQRTPVTGAAPTIADAAMATSSPNPRLATVSAQQQLWQSRRLAGLPEPSPIQTGEIQPAALAVPLLQVKPLVTQPLTIEPMDGGG